MDEIQPPLEEIINIDDLVLSSNQTEMQDVRNDSMSIEIKQERVEYDTRFLHVENENTLLRKKLEESMNLQKVVTEKLASSVIKIQQIQGEKKETIANFTKSEVEKDKLRVKLTKTKQELEKTKMENKRLTSQVKELINPVLTSKQKVAEILKESLKEGNKLIEKDELIIELAEIKLELQRSQVRNEKVKSQNQKYKEVISVLISAQDEDSKKIQFEEQDTVSTDHLDHGLGSPVKILENGLDLKTDDHSTVVKIPIRKKNKLLKTKSNDGEQKNGIDENTKNLEQMPSFDEDIMKKQRKCARQSKTSQVHLQSYVVKKKFHCKYCEKGFNTKSHLKEHEMIHTGERPYSCNTCKKGFIKKSNLKKHELIHGGEKSFQCEYCEKGFNSNSLLKRHEMIHTGEKPFSCQYCEKRFMLKSHCKEHETIHTGEKPYSCQYCEKCFIASSSLKVHVRIHTGEKPYPCQYCSKRFNQLSNLKWHEKKVHTRKIVPVSKE